MDNISTATTATVVAVQDPANNNPQQRSATVVVNTDCSRKSSCDSIDGSKLRLKIVGPDEQEVSPDEIVVPPDGGYGYVIVFAAFMSNVIVDGIVFSFGSLKDSIYETTAKQGAPIEQAALMWVGSFLTGFSLLFGPFASAAANKFGFRIVAMFGSTITAAAFIASWYFNRDKAYIGILILLYGILGGIGFGCMHVPACISVGFYFEKKRAIATGLALCGSGIGSCIFPPLITYLTVKLGWQGTVLVTGTIVLLSGFLGLLYKPLKPPKDRKAKLVVTIEDPECRQVLSEIKKNIMINNFANEVMKGKGDGNEESRVKSDVLHQIAVGRKMSNPSMFTAASSIPSWTWTMQKKRVSVPTVFAGSSGEIPTFQFPSSSPPPAVSGEDSNDGALKPTTTASMKAKSIIVGATLDLEEIIEEERNSQDTSSKASLERQAPTQSQSEDKKQQASSTFGMTNNATSSLLITRITSNNGARMVGSIAMSCRVGNSMQFVDDRTNSRVIRLASKSTLNKPLYRDDIFFGGSLFRIPDYANNPEMSSIEWSAAVTSPTMKEECSLAAEEKVEMIEDSQYCDCSCELVNKMLDFSLLLSPTFFMFALSGMFTMLGMFVPFVFLVDHAYETLIQQSQSSVDKQTLTLLISLIGVANTVGRIVSGWIADRPFVNAMVVNNLAVTVMGISTLMVPFLREYSYFIAYSCVFGLSMACFSSLRTILVVELLGLAKLTNAFGLLLLFQGIAAVVATPLAGMIAQLGGDEEGNGDLALAFYAAGGFLLSSAFMCYPLGRINQWEKHALRKESNK